MENGGEILRLFATPGFGTPGRFRRFKEWLEQGSYTPLGGVAADSFELTAHDVGDLTGALTDEFCAWALTAFESMLEVERGAREAKALAWPAIKSYYASFFAAHAVMRFLGYGCVWLAASDLARVKQVAGIHNALVGAGPKKGQWKFTLKPNSILFEHCGGGSGGGAHDDVWKVFSAVMDDAAAKVSSSPLVSASDSQDFLLFVDAVVKEVKDGMPSAVRNAVNYRRDYGVWYPYANFDRSFLSLSTRSLSWRNADTTTPMVRPLSDFAALMNFSQSLTSLSLSLSQAAAKYFDGRAKRFSSGPLKLVALTGI